MESFVGPTQSATLALITQDVCSVPCNTFPDTRRNVTLDSSHSSTPTAVTSGQNIWGTYASPIHPYLTPLVHGSSGWYHSSLFPYRIDRDDKFWTWIRATRGFTAQYHRFSLFMLCIEALIIGKELARMRCACPFPHRIGCQRKAECSVGY